MSEPMNPFARLRLPTAASRQEVVERGQELGEETSDEAVQRAIKDAVGQINTHPDRRIEHAFLEMPGTDYDAHEAHWETFAKQFRRPVVKAADIEAWAEAFAAQHLDPAALMELLTPLIALPAKADFRQPPQSDTPASATPPPMTPADLF